MQKVLDRFFGGRYTAFKKVETNKFRNKFKNKRYTERTKRAKDGEAVKTIVGL